MTDAKNTSIEVRIEQLNAALPQTQCRLCTYDGCKPYAEAIVRDNETINLCLPGGVRGLKRLAKLTEQDATPYIAELQNEEKPRMRAVVREDECIGCVKCIRACPVDAILGARKRMHTVIASECNGCELCVEPCPMDCIDIITLGRIEDVTQEDADKNAALYRERFENREKRLIKLKQQRRKHAPAQQDKKQAIADALKRMQAKKT